nr:PREDICTED: uncharacterized protein LOC105669381 isoform X1 [Linepithema humile]
MTWLVVRFKEEDTVEAVPKTWFLSKESACYWPSKSYDNAAIKALIKKKHNPGSTWIKYEAIVLGTYDDLKIAKKKAIKAQSTDDLSSHTEILTKKKNKMHKRRQDRKKHNSSDTDKSNESNRDMSDEDSNTYPSFSHFGNTHVERDSNRSPTESQDKNITNDNFKTTDNADINAEFKRQFFKEIHLIHLKLNDLMRSIDMLIKKPRCIDEPELNDDTNMAVKTLIQSFPVITEQQLMSMEVWLSNATDNIHALSNQLRLIGGTDLSHLIKGVMSRVISNEVGMLYSWEGARQKKPFKSLKFVQVIIGVVRLNSKTKSATESDIIEVIRNWLVRSKERSNKFQSKQKLKENTVRKTGSVCETDSTSETVMSEKGPES